MGRPEERAREIVNQMSRYNLFTRKDKEVREAYYATGYREAIVDVLKEVRELCNVRQVIETLEGMR